MCGIIGYIGPDNGIQIVFDGLVRLEYRGYDSVGIGFRDGDHLTIIKSVGRIERSLANPDLPSLEDKLKDDGQFKYYSNLVIGHTRWATHGEPTERNAHPHLSHTGRFAIVHNGIIENYLTLKDQLLSEGYEFRSDTDSEVIAHLIDYYYDRLAGTPDDRLLSAVEHTMSKLEGAYAFLVISSESDVLIGAKRGSPLCAGIGKEEYILSSDEMAFVGRLDKVVHLDDNEIFVGRKTGYKILSLSGKEIIKELSDVSYDIESVSKGGYPHYMLKEIHEQPITIRNCFASRIDHLETLLRDNFPKLPRNINRVIYLGCGTSLYAGMIGSYITEKYTDIPSRAEYASEFIYRDPVLFRNDVVLAISQSGETADTKEALRLAKDKGCYVGGIVNVVGSQIARLAGKGMYLHAGPEIGVASTKAFTSQLTALTLFNMILVDDDEFRLTLTQKIKELPTLVERVLSETEPLIKSLAPEVARYKNFLYLGRGINYPVALEGALKMKEIAYLHAEGYSSGEMKHGPIALVDENLLSVFIITGEQVIYSKTLNNLLEIKARKGRVLVITDNPDEIEKYITEDDLVITVPQTHEVLSPIVNVIPLQLLAYYVANELGREIDKPRNLAKSVTVE